MSNEQKPPPEEDTSFSSLMSDAPEGFAPVHEAPPDKMDDFGELSPEDVLRLQEKAEMDEKLNSRVLAAGSVERSPMHVSSLVLGFISLGMLLFQDSFPYFAYIIMLVSLGAAAWGINGAIRDDPPAQRGMCAAGAAMGIIAFLVALL